MVKISTTYTRMAVVRLPNNQLRLRPTTHQRSRGNAEILLHGNAALLEDDDDEGEVVDAVAVQKHQFAAQAGRHRCRFHLRSGATAHRHRLRQVEVGGQGAKAAAEIFNACAGARHVGLQLGVSRAGVVVHHAAGPAVEERLIVLDEVAKMLAHRSRKSRFRFVGESRHGQVVDDPEGALEGGEVVRHEGGHGWAAGRLAVGINSSAI